MALYSPIPDNLFEKLIIQTLKLYLKLQTINEKNKIED